MSQYASKDDMIGAMHTRIAELESELEAQRELLKIKRYIREHSV